MKTNVDKYIDKKVRNVYDIHTKNEILKKECGLNEEIVKNISKEKNEPKWVLDIRLKALKLYDKLPTPDWSRYKFLRYK